METECVVRNSHKRSSYIYRHCFGGATPVRNGLCASSHNLSDKEGVKNKKH